MTEEQQKNQQLLKDLILEEGKRINQINSFEDFHTFCLNFYFDSIFDRPINLTIKKYDADLSKKLEAYNYPKDFIEWHSKFGNYQLWIELFINSTEEIVDYLAKYDNFELLRQNNYLIAATDSGGNIHVYDMNVSPPELKFVDHESVYYDIVTLEEFYSEKHDFWRTDDGSYRNSKKLDEDEIFDKKGDFRLNSIYIKEHLAQELKKPGETNFLTFLKDQLHTAFEAIIDRYEPPILESTAEEIIPNWKILHNKAHALDQNKMYEYAIKEYHKVLKIHESPETYMGLGVSLARGGYNPQAIIAYNKSIELNPTYKSPYNNRAFEYYLLKEYDKALKDISYAIELDGEDALAHATKAEILFGMNDEEAFFESFEKSLSLGISPFILDAAIGEKYAEDERYIALLEKY
ncbi:MAG: hypothetical protein GQ574_24600 [Crocinitomix sp.]|nr:hypothetical protein [Crocinitomix sp.]